MHLRYSYRIYPTAGQRASLARTFGCARVVYNDALAVRKEARKGGLPYPKSTDLQKLAITAAKKTPERAWLASVGVDPLIQSLRDLDTAYRNFFDSVSGKRQGRPVGLPRFKSKRDARQSLRFTRNGFRIRSNGKLNLAKIGDVRVKWSRALPADPSSVTIVLDPAGRYHASFVVDVEPVHLPEVDAEIGIDLGLTTYAVLSDGSVIDNPRFLRKAEKKLKAAQRELSRKAKGSKNRAKVRIKVARAHAKVADTRMDWLHQQTTRIIRETQTVYLEDLNVRGLARGRLAKSVHDAGWSTFRRLLEEKAARYGRTIGIVHRAFPSSQLCSDCGHRDGPKPLQMREWACGVCGVLHDRDLNAARNILAAGQADRLNAPGGPVRPGAAIPRQARPVERGTRLGDLPRTGVRAAGAGGIPVP
ncbi:RNA-guided endonuclease InsQ/TnpB family protein [Kitasatospora cathayae]|uniref:RNA-guided endonuclease TnpB family protein n=1 Tax=Kitasatospora cathayae TaxID=3004092 RepID=A0ABY7Q2S9_9ACTN|nr:RNA-guided endonuclease TnpB family protein [Kitasatospora sp. HUAS 3-15]WBP86998.1 RNA-guided endonuclease TnpB family protein [Kitasatospora sp. HUAS 3-15]